MKRQLPQARDAAEAAQQLLRGALADTGYFNERRSDAVLRSPLAVESDREAMRLVSDLLNQVQHRRVAFERIRLVFVAEHIQKLFFLGDACERLVDDFEFLKRLGASMQLPDAAIDENQTRHGFAFIAQAAIPAFDGLAHARKIIAEQPLGFVAPLRHRFAANDEFAIVGFFHAAVFPHDHRGNRIRSLNMRNIERFNSLRRFRKAERGFHRLGDRFRTGLQYAEALDEGMLGVLFDQFKEGVFLPALWVQDFDAMARVLAQNIFQQRALLEPYRHVYVARQIGGIEVKLLEKGSEKFGGIECVEIFPVEITPVDHPSAA